MLVSAPDSIDFEHESYDDYTAYSDKFHTAILRVVHALLDQTQSSKLATVVDVNRPEKMGVVDYCKEGALILELFGIIKGVDTSSNAVHLKPFIDKYYEDGKNKNRKQVVVKDATIAANLEVVSAALKGEGTDYKFNKKTNTFRVSKLGLADYITKLAKH
jgi:hypothetical protein